MASTSTASTLVSLASCPPGLFLFNDTLGFRSEYGHDAYVVESGEFFWGGATDKDARALLLVTPLASNLTEEIRMLREIIFTLAIAAACLSQPTHSVRKALAQKWAAYLALVTTPATEDDLADMQQW